MKMKLFPLRLLLAVCGCVISAGDALVIHNATEFIAFGNAVNGGSNYLGNTVFLANDIDFNGYSSQFTIIGTTSKNFRGTFDGQGHTI